MNCPYIETGIFSFMKKMLDFLRLYISTTFHQPYKPQTPSDFCKLIASSLRLLTCYDRSANRQLDWVWKTTPPTYPYKYRASGPSDASRETLQIPLESSTTWLSGLLLSSSPEPSVSPRALMVSKPDHTTFDLKKKV
jgi:hypothetical protein